MEQIGEVPVIALTATATAKVQLDIQKKSYYMDATFSKHLLTARIFITRYARKWM
jgi:superfamily II DNA helicase RecQ